MITPTFNVGLIHNDTASLTNLRFWVNFYSSDQTKSYVSFLIIKEKPGLVVQDYSSGSITAFPAASTVDFCTACEKLVGLT
jgi:hypothetical protein